MINTEAHDWGTRLICQPLPKRELVQISVDVNYPKPGRSADITLWFSGIPVQTPLKPIEGRIWVDSIIAILEAAKKVGEEMKVAAEKKAARKKKATKKK